MPQPTFATSGGIGILKFGNQALPNGQGTLSYINLNDRIQWWCQPVNGMDYDNRQLSLGQYVWRARSAHLGEDWGPWKFRLPFLYDEDTSRGGSGVPFGQALAQITQAGEQFLTFDNATGILVKFSKLSNRKMLVPAPPYLWAFDLEFMAKAGWFQDLSTTTLSTVNIVNAPTAAPTGATAAGGALTTGTYTLSYTYVTSSGETAPSPASSNIVLTTGNQQISVSAVTPLPAFATAVKWYFGTGSPSTGFTVQNNGAGFTLNTPGSGVQPPTSTPATSFSIAYAGSVFCEPVFTLTIPVTNAAVISSVTLANSMSGEQLIAQLGGLAASTAYTITMDSGAMTIADGTGKLYDNTGNAFPNLYGPAGQSNAFTVAVAVSSGLPSGLTLGGSWNPRWEI